ncbi:rhombotarget lipoprotein [bacterium]|nr:rhombotarget lipoprotein [bacterium]
MKRIPINLLVGLTATLILTAGCGTFTTRSRHHSSSMIDYLYPKGLDQPVEPGIPTLRLPLRVGVAWVPDQSKADRFENAHPLSSENRQRLLDQVVPQFRSYNFIKSIDVIPSAYLSPHGGFVNLDQIRAMYGVDVIALVSYDQMQFTDEGMLTFAYWTIVGAYAVKGERNETQTMVDTAVYDVASRRLLFRAPGISRIKASATPVNLSEQLRHDSEEGFQQAATNMVANLQTELAQFQTRVKDSPDDYKVEHRPGYTGVGGMGTTTFALAGVLGLGALFRRQSSKA